MPSSASRSTSQLRAFASSRALAWLAWRSWLPAKSESPIAASRIGFLPGAVAALSATAPTAPGPPPAPPPPHPRPPLLPRPVQVAEIGPPPPLRRGAHQLGDLDPRRVARNHRADQARQHRHPGARERLGDRMIAIALDEDRLGTEERQDRRGIDHDVLPRLDPVAG